MPEEDALTKMGLTVDNTKEKSQENKVVKKKAKKAKKTISRVKTVDDGHAVEFPDDARIENLGRVQPPTLANASFDPFSKYKTDPDRYHYRALHTQPMNLSRKQAAGYDIVTDEEKGGSVQFGDLVLGRIDKGLYDARTENDVKKAKSMTKNVKKQTESQLHEQGFKTFEPD
jgi:hypothetical protein